MPFGRALEKSVLSLNKYKQFWAKYQDKTDICFKKTGEYVPVSVRRKSCRGNDTMVRENNALAKYLESEIERLKKEIENKKEVHYVNQKIIEECQERVRSYRDKEDSIFGLLSPIAVESSYQEQIDAENQMIAQTNEENMTLIAGIAECNDKINEIQKQLKAQTEEELEPLSSNENESAAVSAEDEAFQQEWTQFIQDILEELKQAEEEFYTDPAACKRRISGLRTYIIDKCYGR